MLYYVLNKRDKSFETFTTSHKVGTYLLGKGIENIIIFKVKDNCECMYIPTTPLVFQIEKELETL